MSSGEAPAWFAAVSAVLTAAAVPLDTLLQPLEARQRAKHRRSECTIIIVCGPPRSGTTLVALALIRALDLSYFTNHMVLFPRAPITASRLFGVHPRPGAVDDLRNYYGRTAGFRRPNDALPIWDRFLGSDRTEVPTSLDQAQAQDLSALFATLEVFGGRRPVLSKNNGLNASAHVVASALPRAVFLCMEREPIYLAQSLLQARRQIHGDDMTAYGLHGGRRFTDPVADVVSQVQWHTEIAEQQAKRIGADRFWRVSYEDFCADPANLLEQLAGLPGITWSQELPTLRASRRMTLNEEEFSRVEIAVNSLIE